MEAFFGLVAEKVVLALGSEALNAIGYAQSQGLQLREVNALMRRIRSEFEHMQTFISNVDLQKHSATIEPWMKRAREIAESMEDVIDEYLYLRAEQSQATTCYYYMIPFDRCNILGSNPWSDIDTRLKEIETDLAHLKEMKVRYDISKLEFGEAGSSTTPEVANGRKAFDPASLDTANEDGITLFETERDELIEWLTDDQAERVVFVVWGMGGLGKTTLVKNVYENQIIKKHFDCKAWVTVSSKYDPNGLLTQLLKQLLVNYEERNSYMQDRGRLIEIVKDFLEEKKYLLVLDDVWADDAFTDLQKIIPRDSHGSRVVVTTRSQEIAEKLDNEDRDMYINLNLNLSKLDEDQAWDLFCWEAFGRKGTDACPPVLEKTGKEILKRCDGLPLAIVAIAKVMSKKRKNDVEWKRVLDKLSWEFNNNPKMESMKHVLNLSFDELPNHLKNCFLYCTVFPAYCIERSKLIKLWVAESFVQDRGSETKEKVAEDYFNELVQRSMLHVVDVNRDGTVRMCQIPEVVRNITLSMAWKERFSIVRKESEPSQLGQDARRLSVHECTTNQSSLFKMDFSRIRSLFIFDYNSSTEELFKSVSSTARYLRVLDLENAKISKITSGLTGLFNLHYLGLKGTKLKRLPRSIGKLRNLQTLDVRYTKVDKLPKGVTQLTNLRHLLNEVHDESRLGTMHFRRFVRSVYGVWNLKSLQELRMAVDEHTVSRLGNLTALRSLKVSNVKQSQYDHLRNSLSDMTSLIKLTIIAADEREVMQLLDFARVFKNLQKLHLHGRLEPALPAPQTTRLKLPFLRITIRSGGATPPRPVPREVKPQLSVFDSNDYDLRMLCLSWSELKVDPLPMICNLSNLTVLNLQGTSDTVELRFGDGWFPKLKCLRLERFKHLKKIIVEKDALMSLEDWYMIGLSELMLLPKGIESLTALSVLFVSECNPFFLYEIQGGHNHSVDQIPQIVHRYKVDDGKWFYESLTRSSAAASTKRAPPKHLPQLKVALVPLSRLSRPSLPPSSRPSSPPSSRPSRSPSPASPHSQGAEIEPQEVPANRVPSPSMQQTKSCAELPNSGSRIPDLNFQDLMLDEQQIGVAKASSEI